MKTVLDHLFQSLKRTADFNSEIQEGPHCILWPDKDHQWEPVISRLQSVVPELLVLGKYNPDKNTGPAIWLRCAIARMASEVRLPTSCTPILYLPGVSRQDLRATEGIPAHLKPLAELQYRGATWSQENGKDWTILSFLVTESARGLGLDVSADNETKASLQSSLSRMLDVEVSSLKNKRLDCDFFNSLLTSGDPIRDFLSWLNDAENFKQTKSEAEWKAFVAICKSQFAFDPEQSSTLDAATKLASRNGTWKVAWDRFAEVPKRFSGIPKEIRACSRPVGIFDSAETMGGWPQWNEEQEKELGIELLAILTIPEHSARKKILELERKHCERRSLVWADLGEANLAKALKHLAVIAEIASDSKWNGEQEDLAAAYRLRGWMADDALLHAIQRTEDLEELSAVSAALRAVYLPWLEQSAIALQSVVEKRGYKVSNVASPEESKSTCILFVDGLRFDIGKRLAEVLTQQKNLSVDEIPAWAALPSVTATGKAAVSPVSHKISGKVGNADFEPCVASSGQSLKGGYHFRKLLVEEGWQVLEENLFGDASARAWCEFGNIDSEGHLRGYKLAKHVDGLLGEIADRIAFLLESGWKTVKVVTDHGWLLLPGGLPKIELAAALVESKWGRCAALKEGAQSREKLFPWRWNPAQSFVLANGISCFKNGEEYAHGGLSFQECLTLHLNVRAPNQQNISAQTLTVVKWSGFRCVVSVEGEHDGTFIDIRLFAGDASSSIAHKKRHLREDGTASVLVENEELQGREAVVVLIDCNGKILSQSSTVIGGRI